MDKAQLKEYGIDYDIGMRNCMNNEALYRRIMSLFLQDQCFSRAKEAYAQGNQQELFSCMHELKGSSGNVALLSLYNATVPLVEQLRKSNTVHLAETERLFNAAEAAYDRAYEGISVFIKE